MSELSSGARSGYRPIADYALIGDCHTAALVSSGGSIDWYCPVKFDAPAVFCRILDAERGGYLIVAPAGDCSVSRRYLGSTNVLETTFSTGSGTVRVIDAMVIYKSKCGYAGKDVGTSRRVIRLVEGLVGDLEMELSFKPTFDFARKQGNLSVLAGGAVADDDDGLFLALTCPGVDLRIDPSRVARGRFRVGANGRQWVVLTDADDPDRAREALGPSDWDAQLDRTREYWERWTTRCGYRGAYQAEVLRSALALKLLVYEPTGAIVAAPTTSLPEEIGGVRNWDYRFSWLRDSAMTLYALMGLGYQDEATDFFHWLERTHRSDPTALPQIMYDVQGGRDLTEKTVDNLEGYRCSRPVRVGNGASKQLQLGILGQLLTAAYMHYASRGVGLASDHRNPEERHLSDEGWKLLHELVEQAASLWREPDNGIWEMRCEPQLFVYSRLMCWAALEYGLRFARDFGLPAPINRWRRAREAVRKAILTEGYSPDLGAFTQAFASHNLDAAVLAIPRVGFLPHTDRRVQSTIDRIRADLTHNGLVYRYRGDDCLPGHGNSFTACGFWMVDALALSGRMDEACEQFELLLRHANDVGLLSEEINADNGELVGNFPQGLSHLSMIQSAINLAKAAKHGPEAEAEVEAERAGRAKQAVSEGYPENARTG